MKQREFCRSIMDKVKCLALTLVSLPLVGLATTEETFEVLQVGSNTYRNVTVTTKGSDYIFIQHSTGMSNLKLAQLSPEVRDQLGYKPEPKKFSSSKDRISSWATQTLGNVDLSRLKQLEQTFRPHSIDGAPQPAFDQTQLLSLAAIALLCYIFYCYCGKLICEKTGNEPGALIWVPILQLFPLLRAAGMSSGWFLVFFIPVLNLIGYMVWAINIAQSRGKSGWIALFLLLPPTHPFALLYLALSSGTPPAQPRKIEILALETA